MSVEHNTDDGITCMFKHEGGINVYIGVRRLNGRLHEFENLLTAIDGGDSYRIDFDGGSITTESGKIEFYSQGRDIAQCTVTDARDWRDSIIEVIEKLRELDFFQSSQNVVTVAYSSLIRSLDAVYSSPSNTALFRQILAGNWNTRIKSLLKIL